ncbi:DUF4235 domain-containing protein [Raineyella fluvialis]|nr:DUF4235 domain-containing protein [Raineyella fluvialis]
MAIAETLVYKAYTALATTVATVVAHKALTAGWQYVTGEEPPEPTDPDANLTSAVLWALASAAGVAVAQVVAHRVGTRYLFTRGQKFKPHRIGVKV